MLSTVVVTGRDHCYGQWQTPCPEHAEASVLLNCDLGCHQHPGSPGVSIVVNVVSIGHSWLCCGQCGTQFLGNIVLRIAITVLVRF